MKRTNENSHMQAPYFWPSGTYIQWQVVAGRKYAPNPAGSLCAAHPIIRLNHCFRSRLSLLPQLASTLRLPTSASKAVLATC
jgi:hypothetical protein